MAELRLTQRSNFGVLQAGQGKNTNMNWLGNPCKFKKINQAQHKFLCIQIQVFEIMRIRKFVLSPWQAAHQKFHGFRSSLAATDDFF